MAELLTNNPEAMLSLNNRSFEAPCGFFRLSPCSYNNFNDWYNTLKSRYSILLKNWTKLKNYAAKEGVDDLTPDEISLGNQVNDLKDGIDGFKDVKPGQHRDIYAKYIYELQGLLTDTNSLIETAQEMLEARDQRYITTGINARPGDGTGWGLGTWALIAVGAAGTYWAYKRFSKPSARSIASTYTPKSE